MWGFEGFGLLLFSTLILASSGSGVGFVPPQVHLTLPTPIPTASPIPPRLCCVLDVNGDGRTGIDELIKAVHQSLHGCPMK